MRTLGIDLASDPVNTALCVLGWEAGRAAVEELVVGAGDDDVLDAHRAADVTGIDCPFGWPTAFLAFLCATSRPIGEPLPAWSTTQRDNLRFRLTDVHVREVTGRWPLSVSSDLIAVPALRCQGLLTRMGVTDRSGDGRVYEVYPAAALARWGFPSSRYKKGRGQSQRERVVRDLQVRAGWLRLSKQQQATLLDSDDALDALVAALNARAAKLGLTLKPQPDEHREAAREGWIAIPEANSLEKLARG